MKKIKYNDYIFKLKRSELILDERIDSYLLQHLDEKRYFHSFSVGVLSYLISVKNGLKNNEKYLICGLLHDVGKYLGKNEEKKIMKKYFPEYIDLPPYAYHAFTSAYLLKKDLNIDDPEILDAIMFHTTGNENMSDLAKVIYAADKIDPLRGYDSAELVDAMYKNFDDGFKLVVKENKLFLEEKKCENNILSQKMYDYYL